MALSAGDRLGSYEIVAPLGAGGMGEVYRATDRKLGRDVAIKVLPAEVAQDPERLARFQREAHLLASLNHPSIASIYGLEEAEGKPFLALELVEGEDLKERLQRGPLPVDEALEVAEQVAEALEEAHGKGIVHRDLKPANVKLTPDGKAKVLDFGLAKAWAGDAPEGSSPSAALSQSPTLAHTGTVAGVILGTAAYMSPEQARGKPVDKRADVWSFGVLLWEMLTGRALFTGETVTDVIAQVVTREPDLDALPRATPSAVRRMIARCLRRDPRTRLPDMGAARLDLQDVRAGRGDAADAAEGLPEAAEAQRGRRRERWGWLAVAAALAALAGGLAFVHLREVSPPRPPAGQFVVEAPEGWRFHAWGWPVPSPDGRQILFRAVPEATGHNFEDEDRSTVLWTRPLESLTARLLAGTEHVEHPFWSPDGESVGFFADGELRRLALAGGTVQRICALPRSGFPAGADWNADGTIAFAIGGAGDGEIFTVAADGGEPEPFAPPGASAGGPARAFPQFLSGGRRLGFLSGGEGLAAGYYVATLDDPADTRRLSDGLVRVALVGGYAFFVQGATLVARPFDAEEVALSGAPVAVATSVGRPDGAAGIGWFGVSPGGTLAYLAEQVTSGEVQLTWVDRKGGALGTIGAPGDYGQIVLSPDERKVAVEIRDDESGYDLWVVDVARGVPSRVTAAPGDERNPVWSPDGRSLVFSSLQDGEIDLRRKEPRATAAETVLEDSPGGDYPESWSPDGRTLLFIRQPAGGEQSVWALSPEGGAAAEAILDTDFFVDEPQISPDGRWLAYASNESGRSEVYVEPFRRQGERVRVSVEGGGQPKWRGDGRELFFARLDGRLMSVDFRAVTDSPQVGLPVELFEIAAFSGPNYDDYAPGADGQRFLVKRPVDEARPRRMHVVTNWPSLLE
ncbi:MAG: serine/threonine-protein kinase [Acidobacteria bacterium]|jgi:Tol biopolymer transport system component|nr:serine/threonine-protein kinase [Acidobacteriota bacterium]